MIAQRSYVRYSDDVEVPDRDEDETIDRIAAAMQREGEITRECYGRAVRTSHAKAHGLRRRHLHLRFAISALASLEAA